MNSVLTAYDSRPLCATRNTSTDPPSNDSKTRLKPTVLLATTTRWFPTARLAMALARAGFDVEAVCFSGHQIERISAVRRTHTYHGLAPLKSFANAISATSPDLVVPGDDLATHHLHELYVREQRRGEGGGRLCALIERSLGAPESFPIVNARAEFIEAARQEGIAVPETEAIANRDDLRKWIARSGLPTVLKADGTWGGAGVRFAQTIEEAEGACQMLQAPPLLSRAAKRALLDADTSLVWPSMLRHRSTVNGQAFIQGREATSLIACCDGTVLASLQFEVLKKRSPSEPATVVRLIENADMAAAGVKMARRLKLSGFHGFDFMLESCTRKAYLIEINPRPTQVGHLTLGLGRDLPAALYSVITGEPIRPAPKLTENDTITLFPHEWAVNPASPFLQSSYHDVPWEEPELVRAGVQSRGKQRARLSQPQLVPFEQPTRVSSAKVFRSIP